MFFSNNLSFTPIFPVSVYFLRWAGCYKLGTWVCFSHIRTGPWTTCSMASVCWGPESSSSSAANLKSPTRIWSGKTHGKTPYVFFPLINGNKMLFFLLSPTGKGVVGKKQSNLKLDLFESSWVLELSTKYIYIYITRWRSCFYSAVKSTIWIHMGLSLQTWARTCLQNEPAVKYVF